MTIVIDASMTIAWLFRDERGDLPQTVLRRVVAEGGVAPSIWRLEVANVMRNSVRRGRCSEDYAERCLQRLGRLRIVIDAETDRHAWGATRTLSRQYNLTLYDAAYLELAVRLQSPLASCDRALLDAARASGLHAVGA